MRFYFMISNLRPLNASKGKIVVFVGRARDEMTHASPKRRPRGMSGHVSSGPSLSSSSNLTYLRRHKPPPTTTTLLPQLDSNAYVLTSDFGN